MATRRHLIGNQGAEVVAGLAAFAVAWALLWDAYEGRGQAQPRLLRPFTWW